VKARYHKHLLEFKKPSGTSRGILKARNTYIIILEKDGILGLGEASPLQGLSIDDRPDFEEILASVLIRIQEENLELADIVKELDNWPAIRFGLETAYLDLEQGGRRIPFPSDFTSGDVGIPINGLVWMGTKAYMKEQITSLLGRGFTCLKMKIGAINFKDELEILTDIRSTFSEADLTLRVDANGAFGIDDALEKLKRLSDLKLHSIEQPIAAGLVNEMAMLCEKTPLPIALDEELISTSPKILERINPQYIILKPTLIGGFEASEAWIAAAETKGVGWWITSALESNIGLNAISQWTYRVGAQGHQGLGTGSLYKNNFESPLEIVKEQIRHNVLRKWELDGVF